jgi:hypothetical protein
MMVVDTGTYLALPTCQATLDWSIAIFGPWGIILLTSHDIYSSERIPFTPRSCSHMLYILQRLQKNPSESDLTGRKDPIFRRRGEMTVTWIERNAFED